MSTLAKALPGLLCALFAAPLAAQTVTRGPYLQQQNDTSIVVRWRTSTAVVGRVRYGTSQGSLTQTKDGTSSTVNHAVTLTGLSPNTRYYYSVGTSGATLAGGTAGHFFVTSPTPGTAKKARIWVIGDAGTANSSQRAVRDAYYAFTGSTHTDLWLMLGDNAYNDGTDAQYQAAVFDMYPTLLAKSTVWSTYGNHDGHSASSSSQSGPYYEIFTNPKNGECGGLASGTEAYYAFDYGNIHFISLDSYQTSRAVGGAMHTWAKNDANATARDWLIAFWHHPPYTKGSHNSDSEGALIDMRKNFLPILEDAGVDLVLCGHSHSYERSFLIDGHYGSSSTFTNAMKKDGGSGRDPNPYTKPGGLQPHEGTVYVVAGSSGKTSGGTLNHPVMFVSLNKLGSLVLDIDGDRLDAKFLRENGTIEDSFTIVKTASAPPPADTTKPTVAITSPTSASTYSTTTSSVVLGGTASDNVGVQRVEWSNAAGGSGTATGTTSWSATVALFAGSNAITVTAYDAAGNSATDTITATYTPPTGDTTKPAIAIQSPTTSSTWASTSEPVTVSGTASDDVGVVTVTWTNAATGDSGAATGTTSWSASIELATGDNLVTVTAKDAAGNTASDTLTVTYTAPAAEGSGGSSGEKNPSGMHNVGEACGGSVAGGAGGPLLAVLSLAFAGAAFRGRRRR